MAMTIAGLSAAIKAEILATSTVTDDAELQKFCDAVGKAVVNYIKANAEVPAGIAVTGGNATIAAGSVS